MPDTPLIRRDAYAPADHTVRRVDLDIAIHDDHAIVTARLEVERASDNRTAPLVLRGGKESLLEKLIIDGKAVDTATLDTASGRIEIHLTTDAAVVETVTRINPYTNTGLEGLYLSGDMLCTQCEPEGFRHITWHPDRPDVLGVYTTRIEAPARFPVLLANGNLVREGQLDGGRHFAVWHDPFPKPSYLFAMVAGDLDLVRDSFTTMDGRDVDLRIYVEHGNAERTAHAMASLKRAMAWDEKVYGLAYDLDIFMIVAVSHFNMGAMENKGLNIFNSKYILADAATASDGDLENVEAIVAHEYFHNWTGNRITCRDWFQLTLKEGLTVFRDQEFTADMHSAGVKRADDVTVLRAAQFPEDKGPTAHPIRPDTYSEINNFYTPTVYEKGAEVIRMIETLLGHDGFMAGMRLYVERHDGAAVTCEDFIAAMEDANGADFTLFRRWYGQAGTPRLDVTARHDKSDGTMTLKMKQSLPATAAGTAREPLVIPVRLGLIGADGAEAEVKIRGADSGGGQTEAVVVLDETEKTVILENADAGSVPSILRGFSAPVEMTTDLDDTARLHLLAHDSDAFGRWDAGQGLMMEAVRGLVDGDDARGRIEKLGLALIATINDERLDGAEKAQILRIPPQATIEAMMDEPDPVRICGMRRVFAESLGRIMADGIAEQLEVLRARNTDLDAPGRALYVRLLGLAVAAGIDGAENHALELSAHGNMTLAEGALAALNQTAGTARANALDDFAKKWKGDSLVMEKWFALESSAPDISTPAHCENLMRHPVFDAGNPNKLRSVLSVFANANPLNFHAADGSGYEFIARHVADIDRRNPQLAARLVLPLSRFASYGENRKAAMRSALAGIKSGGGISPDLGEVIARALGD